MTTETRRLVHFCTFVVVLTVAWTAFYCFVVNPNSGLWTDYRQVDIHTGQMRTVEYRFWMRNERPPEETWVSKALLGSESTSLQPEWHSCSDESHVGLSHIFTHWRFGAAPYQMQRLEQCSANVIITPEAKKEIALCLVNRWSAPAGSQMRADDYADSLAMWLTEKPDGTLVDAGHVIRFHQDAGLEMK